MFDHMWKENEELKKEFKKEKIGPKDKKFIKEMIFGPLGEVRLNFSSEFHLQIKDCDGLLYFTDQI